MVSQRKLNVALLSLAHMHGYSYASCLKNHPDVQISGVWDDNQERGEQAAADLGAAFYAGIDDVMDSGAEAVVIASENSMHLPLVKAAAEAGKDILCEKPLSTTVENAVEMIRICEEKGVRLFTAFPCRFSPALGRIKELIDSGKLGRIIAISATNRGTMPGGWFIDLEKSGGGAVIDHTVHVVDLMYYLLGGQITEVYAEISNNMHHQHYDDCGLLSFRFDHGTIATLDTSWSRPKSFPTWGDVTMSITGTDGSVELDMFNQKMVGHHDESMRTLYHGWGSNIDAGLINAFVQECLNQKATAIASGVCGMKAVAVALAAYRSVEAGRAISIN